MAIFTDGLPNRRNTLLDEYSTGLGETLGQVAKETLIRSPTLSTYRAGELYNAGLTEDAQVSLGAVPEGITYEAKKVDAETARAKVKELNLKLTIPDDGIAQKALDILIERKQDEVRRQDIINRGPEGIAVGAAKLGTGFAASLLDPVNVASAFIPVVGEARYAYLLAQAGSTASRIAPRLAVGAVEGLVGAALVEPIIYASAKYEQADYTMMDSALNIAFGGVFGGGLHVAGGSGADLYRGWRGRADPYVRLQGLSVDEIKQVREVENIYNTGFKNTGELVDTLQNYSPRVLRAAGLIKDKSIDSPVDDLTTPIGTIFGEDTQVRVGDTLVSAQWAVVDLVDIEATMSKADNQWRDRTRAASSAQIRDISNNPYFDMLENSPIMDMGAPTLSKDGLVIGGNGRVMGVSTSYEIGKSGDYRSRMNEALEKFGIDSSAIEGMKKPMLVRVLREDVDVKKAAIASNEGGSARMSSLEQAGVDSERLGDFRGFDIPDSGDLNTAGNRGAIRQWVGQFPVNQQAALITSEGYLSKEGLMRLRNAILYRAYGDSPILKTLIESTDEASTNLSTALIRSAGAIAEARAAIKRGELFDLDLSKDLQAAVAMLQDLRAKGMNYDDFQAQGDMIGVGLTPEQVQLLSFIDDNIRSPRAISELINGYYNKLKDAGDPRQGDIFGGAEVPSKMDLLDRALTDLENDPSASAKVEKISAETREAALRVSVAHLSEGRGVEVEAVVNSDPIIDTTTVSGAQADAVRANSPENILTVDPDVSVDVASRNSAAPKTTNVDVAQQALQDAMDFANDVTARGQDAYKYSRKAKVEPPKEAGLIGEDKKLFGEGEVKRVLQREIDNLLPEEQVQFDEFIANRADADIIIENLTKHKGTPWAKQAVEGIMVRQAMAMLIRGEEPNFQSSIDSNNVKRTRQVLKERGLDGLWGLIEADGGLMGHAGKPVNNVNSSFINCNPSGDCAKYCYATGGNYRYANVLVKSELVTLAVELDPVRAATRVANEYKATAEFANNKALRLFDKGDGNAAWLPFITELNKKGIRTQIFSKNPDFLRQVPEMNLRLLSIDDSNMKMADDNLDLPVAFVYSGKKQIDALAKMAARNQIQVVLPVKLGQKILDGSDITAVKKEVPEIKPYLCPIDSGFKKLGKTSQEGTWNCTKCDINGGVGCFHGTATKAVMQSSEVKPVSQQERATRILELRGMINEFTSGTAADVGEAGRVPQGRVEGLLQQVNTLLDDLLKDYDTGSTAGATFEFGAGIVGEGKGAEGVVRRTIPIKPVKYGRAGQLTGVVESAETLTNVVRDSFGKSTETLLEVGRVKIVDKVGDLPDGPHPADTRGMTTQDGEVYIVAENVSANEAKGILLHEVGEHVGMQEMLGNNIYNDLLKQVADGIARGDDAFMKAAAAVPTDTPRQHVASEQLAYLIENSPELPLVQKIIATVRAWAFKTFKLAREKMDLTEADIRALAISSLHAVAKNDRYAQNLMDGLVPEYRYSRTGESAPEVAYEMRQFDEAIARAEVYAKVVRAAADRIGDDASAKSAMNAAAEGNLSAQEIDDLLVALRKQHSQVRSSLKKARNEFTAEDEAVRLQDDALEAADQLANNIVLAAVIEKRNAALNMAVRVKGVSLVQSEFKGFEAEGLKALLAGSEMKRRGARTSVQQEQNQFLGDWMGGIINDMEQAGLWQLFLSESMSREVSRALFLMGKKGADTSKIPAEAMKMAEIIHKYQQDARNTQNRFGAWIRDMNGYIVRQTHDMFRIRKASFEEWRDFVLPKLDIKRTFVDRGVTDIEASLREAYNDLASGSHLKATIDEELNLAFKGQGVSVAKKQSQSRTLYFKDGDTWFDYNERFGASKLADAVLQGLERSAKAAGLLKMLGTNPEMMLARMMDEIEDGLRADPQGRMKFHEQRKAIQDLLAHVDGSVNIPANAMGARISAGLRAWQSMAKLGGALISSITDIPVYASEQRFQGRGMYSGIADAISGLMQGRGSAEQREIMTSLGVFFESMRNDVLRRFDAEEMVGGTMSRLQQKFFKWNGLTWWTETLRKSAALSLSASLATSKNLQFGKLRPEMQNMLNLYNIDEGKWDLIRMGATREADGRVYMTPEGLQTIPRAALDNYIQSVGRLPNDAAANNLVDDLASAMRSMFIDRAEHAVIEPDARTRQFLLRGTSAGTVWGETARFIAQFKSFGVALLQRVAGREIYGRGYDTLGDYLKNGKGDMLGLVHLMLMMSVFGYGAMSIKDMLKGRAPRDPLAPKTWVASMLQGGAFGIYGDFLFGEMKNRMGGGFVQTIAGPVLGTADDIMDIWGRLRSGDDAAAQAFRLLISNTPFLNLFYTRIALDYLFIYNIQENLNAGYLRRMERRIEKENDQTFLIKPSEVVR